jgi:serine/threonine protein kinase/Tfp pilus assembly protein PilF
MELGRGGMGVTYKAIDTHLRCPVALKIIGAQFIGNESARSRFLREARAAASVHHPNVATVHHLGESGGNYFYVMEFVDGETLEALIHRRGRLETDPALEIVTQVAAGLTAIHKQRLVHRDIKPSNIMLSWEEGRLENVKIIDLGLAKGATEDTLSIAGRFIGTPTYASPEQFAGLGTDIRSDLCSLGVTLWEMLLGKPPFHGSAAELMDQHQHTAPPTGKLLNVPAPMIALLEVLLEKDASRRSQSPGELQKALPRVKEAIASESPLSSKELRSADDQIAVQSPKVRPRKHAFRWLVAGLLIAGIAILAVNGFFRVNHQAAESSVTPPVSIKAPEKSIAVLPFESLSDNKSDAYFADGVQDEILNNLAKIAQLKVISRTSVMQYRSDTKRDLRQIAAALGVANVLEGAVRRDGNHVRVSTELVDARNDNTIWADSYDRDLTDIFAIQSEVAQTIAGKLTAKLSAEERQRIEARPTENLEAYDYYLRANEIIASTLATGTIGNVARPLREAIPLLEKAVRLDPKFTLAYCASAKASAAIYHFADRSAERRALADAAMTPALSLEPDLPEVHLTYAYYLYWLNRDYERARVQLAMARRVLPNDAGAMALAAYMDRRQGNWDKAIQDFKEAIARDPRNAESIAELGDTLYWVRQFGASNEAYDRLIELAPDQPMLKVQKASYIASETGNNALLRSALASLPASMADDIGVLCWRLRLALDSHDWQTAEQLIEKLGGGEDDGYFGRAAPACSLQMPVPSGCYSIQLARFRGDDLGTNSGFAETREQLNQMVQKSPANALLLCKLGLVDALLNNKEAAISEAKRAVEMLPISKDAVDGPGIAVNLAVVYAWTNEPDLAFEMLWSLTTTPNGIYYGDLKLSAYLDPLRKDPRFEKLLAELAPRE